MSQAKTFLLDNEETMDMYTKAISKVHSANHPEVIQVREEYVNLMDQLNNGEADLDKSFSKFSELTDNYTIPTDACETMTAVYHHLEKADQLQNA